MPQPVREVLAPARVLDDRPCGMVYLGKRDARTHELLCGLVGCAHGLVHAALVLGGLGGEERARHVGAVGALLAAHVEEDGVSRTQHRVVGRVVRVGGVGAKAHDRREGMVLGAERAVLREEPLGDARLGHARDSLLHEPGHRPVVGGGRGAHEVLLAGVLHRAGVVDGSGPEHERARRPRGHERHEPAGGEVLVHAERGVVTDDGRDERHGVVGVREDDHVLAVGVGVGEEAVAEEHRSASRGEEQGEEALVRLGVVAGEPEDGQGVGDDDLLEAHLAEVFEDLLNTCFVHAWLLPTDDWWQCSTGPRGGCICDPVACRLVVLSCRYARTAC